MKTIIFLGISTLLLLLSSCIGDDIIFDLVSESVRITNPLESLAAGETYQLEASYLDRLGEEQAALVQWSSSDTNLLSITAEGLAIGLAKGEVIIVAAVELPDQQLVSDSLLLTVSDETVNSLERVGTIATTSSYELTGDFSLAEGANGLALTLADNYRASSSLPGLYVYLTNNPNSIANALEVSKVTVFSGAHSYEISGSVGLNTYAYVLYYCKPFNVKVGDGKIDE